MLCLQSTLKCLSFFIFVFFIFVFTFDFYCITVHVASRCPGPSGHHLFVLFLVCWLLCLDPFCRCLHLFCVFYVILAVDFVIRWKISLLISCSLPVLAFRQPCGFIAESVLLLFNCCCHVSLSSCHLFLVVLLFCIVFDTLGHDSFVSRLELLKVD